MGKPSHRTEREQRDLAMRLFADCYLELCRHCTIDSAKFKVADSLLTRCVREGYPVEEGFGYYLRGTLESLLEPHLAALSEKERRTFQPHSMNTSLRKAGTATALLHDGSVWKVRLDVGYVEKGRRPGQAYIYKLMFEPEGRHDSILAIARQRCRRAIQRFIDQASFGAPYIAARFRRLGLPVDETCESLCETLHRVLSECSLEEKVVVLDALMGIQTDPRLVDSLNFESAYLRSSREDYAPFGLLLPVDGPVAALFSSHLITFEEKVLLHIIERKFSEGFLKEAARQIDEIEQTLVASNESLAQLRMQDVAAIVQRNSSPTKSRLSADD